MVGKKVLVTGGARRIGREIALAVAQNGADVIIHHSNSPEQAKKTVQDITQLGRNADIIQADFSNPEQTREIFREVFNKEKDLFALINNAAIFRSSQFSNTTLPDWQRHMDINLTVPFLLSQQFAECLGDHPGRIVNILDWRADRPGYDHFPYTISKAGLLSLTKATALAVAPNIQVNGIALGAVLPPSDGGAEDGIIKKVPAKRWAAMQELTETVLFLLNGPSYITGEIIHLDGGRHLV